MSDDAPEYFILLACRPLHNGIPHSFIALGTRDKRTGKIEICSEVGKSLARGRVFSLCAIVLKQVFSHADAGIYDEDALQRKLSKPAAPNKTEKEEAAYPLSYMAYQLSYSQFTHFRTNLESLKNTDDTVPQLDSVDSKRQYQALKRKVVSMSLFNTCRHSAIELTELAQERQLSHQVAPRWFFSPLPFKTAIHDQNWTRQLVILPLPPTSMRLDEGIFHALSKLYERIEKLASQSEKDRFAKEKYQALVELYNSQIKRELINLTTLLDGIHKWQTQHNSLIDRHRAWHFCWQLTATRQCIKEIESMCATPSP